MNPAALHPRQTLTLRLKMAQKPYIMWSLGPKALTYESLEPSGKAFYQLNLAAPNFLLGARRMQACGSNKP